MSTANTFSASSRQKRKRTVVSYAQLDQLADLLSDDEDVATISCDELSDDGSDNEDRTYSRHKKSPKKAPKQKKAKYTRPRKPSNEKPFPFMELPRELRDMIYEMALTDVDGISIVSKTKAYRRGICRSPVYDPEGCHGDSCDEIAPKERSLVPNILAVSKQIHNEATDILYGQRLVFEETDALHRFLAIIGLRNQQRLLSIELADFCTGRRSYTLNHCAFMSLVGATNLKTLRLNSSRWYYGDAKALARGLYRDAHFFLEAYGAANGRKDAAIDILQLDDKHFESFSNHRHKNITFGDDARVVFRAELGRLLGMN